MANATKSTTVSAIAFVSGILCHSLYQKWKEQWKKKCFQRRDAGATLEYNDLSFFYGDKSTYIPSSIPKSRTFLPKDLYASMVHDAIICCTDIILVRHNPYNHKKECLLVERGSEPVKGAWWYPGGRMYKGETFFDTALRKVKEEAGIDLTSTSHTKAKDLVLQVMGVYNTFFPTSAWDTETQKGTQTVNAMVLIVLPHNPNHAENNFTYDVMLDETSERYKWISLDVQEAERNKEDPYVLEGLRRLAAWNATHGKIWN